MRALEILVQNPGGDFAPRLSEIEEQGLREKLVALMASWPMATEAQNIAGDHTPEI